MKTHNKPVILIDFGGVYFTEGSSIARRRISKKFKITEERLLDIMKSSRNPSRKKYNEGRITGQQFWKDSARKLGVTIKQAEQMEKIWHSSYKPNKGMRQLIKKIRRKYRIIVLSGNVKERVEYLTKKYNLNTLFHDQHYSFHHKATKPDVLLFKRMIKKAHLKAEDCIMIDDMENFLEGVRKEGGKGILFNDAKQLEKELKKLGVEI